MESVFQLILVLVLAIHFYMQVVVSALILRQDEEAARRFTQLGVVWLIPIAGVAFISYFVLEGLRDCELRSLPKFALPLLFLTGISPSNGSPEQGDGDSMDDPWTDV